MTHDALTVMQIVVGLAIVAGPAALLHRAVRRGGAPLDRLPLAGYYLLSGGTLLMTSLIGWWSDDLSINLRALSLKLAYLAFVVGVVYLVVLGSLNKNRHRRAMEGIARRQARTRDDAVL